MCKCNKGTKEKEKIETSEATSEKPLGLQRSTIMEVNNLLFIIINITNCLNDLNKS